MGRGSRATTDSAPAAARPRAVRHAIECGEHRVIDLRLGVIDDAAAAAFTGGQCHAMALALHERTGWQIRRMYDDDDDIVHFYIQTPDGRALDITGCHGDEFYDGWGFDCEPVTADMVAADWVDGGMREPDLDAARAYVDAVLGYVDGSRPAHCPPGLDDIPEVPSRRADVMKVAAGDGSRVPVTAGRLDDTSRALLRDQQDHALTRVLGYYKGPGAELLAGASMTVLVKDTDWDSDERSLSHCFTTLADGRALDVDGVHAVEDLISRYGGAPRKVSFRQLNALVDEERPVSDDEAVSTFIPAVLAYLRDES